MHEGVWLHKNYYRQNDNYENLDKFSGLYYKGFFLFYHSAYTGRSTPISKLLIEHFDTLPTQCRHIEHMHKGLWFPKANY